MKILAPLTLTALLCACQTNPKEDNRPSAFTLSPQVNTKTAITIETRELYTPYKGAEKNYRTEIEIETIALKPQNLSNPISKAIDTTPKTAPKTAPNTATPPQTPPTQTTPAQTSLEDPKTKNTPPKKTKTKPEEPTKKKKKTEKKTSTRSEDLLINPIPKKTQRD